MGPVAAGARLVRLPERRCGDRGRRRQRGRPARPGRVHGGRAGRAERRVLPDRLGARRRRRGDRWLGTVDGDPGLVPVAERRRRHRGRGRRRRRSARPRRAHGGRSGGRERRLLPQRSARRRRGRDRVAAVGRGAGLAVLGEPGLRRRGRRPGRRRDAGAGRARGRQPGGPERRLLQRRLAARRARPPGRRVGPVGADPGLAVLGEPGGGPRRRAAGGRRYAAPDPARGRQPARRQRRLVPRAGRHDRPGDGPADGRLAAAGGHLAGARGPRRAAAHRRRDVLRRVQQRPGPARGAPVRNGRVALPRRRSSAGRTPRSTCSAAGTPSCPTGGCSPPAAPSSTTRSSA